MDIINDIAKLTDKDIFLVSLSVKEGDNIVTKCATSNFAYADIPIAVTDMNNNVKKMAVQLAPPTPVALGNIEKVAEIANPDDIPESGEDAVVYADGEGE